MTDTFAVIDLGTNTFHLLIAEASNSGIFKELYRKRIYIKLAEDGINTIGLAPFDRALNALLSFKNILDQYDVKTVKAIGTAALRTASNGPDFIQKVFKETGIQIQLIPGDREADLIYKGVIQAVPLSKETGLIMDIGGGSVEFILADQDGVKWAQSFPIGVAVLYNKFHKKDPISPSEIDILEKFLEDILAPLFQEILVHKPSILIGASGTFDVLENLLCKEKLTPIHGVVNVSDFYPFFQQQIKTTIQERLAMKDIPNNRAEMIIVALVLIEFILGKTDIKTISVSEYALKEGMLKELISE